MVVERIFMRGRKMRRRLEERCEAAIDIYLFIYISDAYAHVHIDSSCTPWLLH